MTAVKSRGFTLLEMVVAIAIFAIMSAMIMVAYVTSVQNQDLAKQHLARLADVQLAFVVVGRAIEQIANRPVRDAFGDEQPAVHVQGGLDGVIEFTHAGKIPMGLPGTTLTRVGFGVEENKLWRYLWPVLDRAQDTTPAKSLLLNQVEAMSFRYLDDKAAWHNNWPVDPFDPHQAKSMPAAIEVTVDTQDWGKLTRVYMLPDYVSETELQQQQQQQQQQRQQQQRQRQQQPRQQQQPPQG